MASSEWVDGGDAVAGEIVGTTPWWTSTHGPGLSDSYPKSTRGFEPKIQTVQPMNDALNDKIQSERDEALATLSDIVDHARYKSLGDGRIRDPEKERIRLKYLRVIISAESERRKILEDKDLDELAEEVERIKDERDTGAFGEVNA